MDSVLYKYLSVLVCSIVYTVSQCSSQVRAWRNGSPSTLSPLSCERLYHPRCDQQAKITARMMCSTLELQVDSVRPETASSTYRPCFASTPKCRRSRIVKEEYIGLIITTRDMKQSKTSKLRPIMSVASSLVQSLAASSPLIGWM
jgi:hypothetical protein